MSSSEMETNNTNTEQSSVVTKNQRYAGYPMKWFKFMIYFGLFVGGLANIVVGYQHIIGEYLITVADGKTIEKVYAIEAYSLFSHGAALKTYDIVIGAIMVAFGVFEIYTRFRLAEFKSNGPACFYTICALRIVWLISKDIALLAIMGINQLFSTSSFVAFVLLVLYWIINGKYFSERCELFIN